VDDGFDRPTFDRLRALHARDSRVRAVRFARNFGQHTAHARGLHPRGGDILVTWTATFRTSPRTSSKLVAAFESGATSPAAGAPCDATLGGRTLPSR
jgi:hypothetical protein